MKAALWLMHQCGVAQSLIGDVRERHATSSTIALWREAVAAIVISLTRDLRMYPLRAAGGVLVGMVAVNVIGSFIRWLCTTALAQQGWTRMVYDLGLRHQQAWLTGLASLVIAIPLWAATGWLMAQVTRTRVGVVAFVTIEWCLAAPHYLHLAGNAFNEPRFRPYFATEIVGIILFSLSIPAGAIWRQRPSGVVT